MLRMCQIASSTLVLLLGVAAIQADDNKSIVGDWTITELFLDGVKQPKEALENRKIVITKDVLSIMDLKNSVMVAWQTKLDDTKTPKWMDLLFNGRIASAAIYKMDKENLLLSIRNKGDKKRPYTFTPFEKDGNMIYKLIKSK